MSKPGLLTLTIKDKSALYLAYMPYVINGGLFIPTNSSYRLGDEVFILLSPFGPAVPSEYSTGSLSALLRITDPRSVVATIRAARQSKKPPTKGGLESAVWSQRSDSN